MERIVLANGDVQKRYGISRSTVLRKCTEGQFPRPVNPSGKPKGRRYWYLDELEAYDRRLREERDKGDHC